jgi:hypothetical protein
MEGFAITVVFVVLLAWAVTARRGPTRYEEAAARQTEEHVSERWLKEHIYIDGKQQ